MVATEEIRIEKQTKKGWKIKALKEIGKIVSGGTPSTTETSYFNGDIAWITPADLTGYNHKFISRGSRNITDEGLKKSSAKVLPKGSVLFSSRAPIGYVAIAANEIATNQGFKNLIPNEGISSEYVYYYLKSAKQLAEKSASGTTFKEISGTAFGELPIPIPELSEQNRIVEKIEELFSELDYAITTLKTTQQQLQTYRQSVLKYLISDTNLKPIESIIETLDQGWSPKCENESSVSNDEWAVIKTTAVQSGKFLEEENKILPKNLKPRTQHELETGDILITRAGPRVRVGICCMVRHVRPKLINCDKVYRMRVKQNIIMPEYFELVMNSPKFLDEIGQIKTGISDSGVNLTQKGFVQINIPVPSIVKQKQIISEIETRLSESDYLLQTINEQLVKAERLRQSILQRAFSGEL